MVPFIILDFGNDPSPCSGGQQTLRTWAAVSTPLPAGPGLVGARLVPGESHGAPGGLQGTVSEAVSCSEGEKREKR